MAYSVFYWMFIALGMLTFQKSVSGEGHIELLFRNYKSDCDDCDPMFTFCVDRPSSKVSVERRDCSYGVAGESDHYHDRGSINFGDNIKGINNPWKVRFGRLHEKSIMVVARTRDDDFFGNDHMKTWGITLTEKVWPTRAQAKSKRRTMIKDDHRITFDIMIYCIEDYYGWNCGKKCLPPTSSDHYTCDTETGNKICHDGWKGKNCDTDIDECELGYCERGDCENLDGNYLCHCPPHFSGRNCSVLGDPCEAVPCKNNGTCLSGESSYNYSCSCGDPWTGQNCTERRDPCEGTPCLNGGQCDSNEDNTNFTCACPNLYFGAVCEEKRETTAAGVPDTTVTESSTTGIGSGIPGQQGQAARSTSESKAGFMWWHALIICILLAIIAVLLILFLLFRRRRKEKHCSSGLPPGQTVVFEGGNLAFENSMYTNGNARRNVTSNGNGVVRQHPPLPTTPTDDDELFHPIKPSSFFSEDMQQGATGGYEPEDAGYMKPSQATSDLEAQLKGKPPATSNVDLRARENPYADFKAMKSGYAGDGEINEAHYQDLDEMQLAFTGLDQETADDVNLVNAESKPGHSPHTASRLKAMAGLPPLSLDNGAFNYSIPSSSSSPSDDGSSSGYIGKTFDKTGDNLDCNLYSEPTSSPQTCKKLPSLPIQPLEQGSYSNFPTNTPAITVSKEVTSPLVEEGNLYSPIDDDKEFNAILAERMSARRQQAFNENQYAAPVEEPPSPPPLPLPSRTSDVPEVPKFPDQEYSDIPSNLGKTAFNPLANDRLDDYEESIQDFGLPPVNAGYASPKVSTMPEPTENLYADPSDTPSQPPPIKVTTYDSPRSSNEHTQPEIPPRPDFSSLAKLSGPSGYDDVSKQSGNLPPAPSIPLPPPPMESDTSEYDAPPSSRPALLDDGLTKDSDV